MTKRDPKREMENGGIIFVQERIRDHTGCQHHVKVEPVSQ